MECLPTERERCNHPSLGENKQTEWTANVVQTFDKTMVEWDKSLLSFMAYVASLGLDEQLEEKSTEKIENNEPKGQCSVTQVALPCQRKVRKNVKSELSSKGICVSVRTERTSKDSMEHTVIVLHYILIYYIISYHIILCNIMLHYILSYHIRMMLTY